MTSAHGIFASGFHGGVADSAERVAEETQDGTTGVPYARALVARYADRDRRQSGDIANAPLERVFAGDTDRALDDVAADVGLRTRRLPSADARAALGKSGARPPARRSIESRRRGALSE